MSSKHLTGAQMLLPIPKEDIEFQLHQNNQVDINLLYFRRTLDIFFQATKVVGAQERYKPSNIQVQPIHIDKAVKTLYPIIS